MNYLFRNIPESLWKKAKHKAVDEGISLRALLINALVEYLEKK